MLSIPCALTGCESANNREGRANSGYAEQLVRQIASRTVPPQATQLTAVRADVRPCVIGQEWSFVTSLDPVRYGQWVASQLSGGFKQLPSTGERLILSRYDQGDAHSLTIESGLSTDGTRVRVHLCVLPTN